MSKIISNTVQKLMREAKGSGEMKQSGDWGNSNNKRSVAIWFENNQYYVAYNVLGFPGTTEIGDYNTIYSGAVGCLLGAG